MLFRLILPLLNIQGLTDEFLDWLLGIGPIGLALIMIIQAIIAPLPAVVFIFTAAKAYVDKYGFYLGVFICVSAVTIGTIIGAFLCYYIGYKGGRPAVRVLIKEEAIKEGERWFNKYGLWTILIARMIPFSPGDPISYVAGIVKMNFKAFSISIIISSIASSFLYSFMGLWFLDLYYDYEWLQNIVALILIFFGIGLLIYLWDVTKEIRKGETSTESYIEPADEI